MHHLLVMDVDMMLLRVMMVMMQVLMCDIMHMAVGKAIMMMVHRYHKHTTFHKNLDASI